MAWANEGVVKSLPNELYCSTPMRAEPEIMKDPETLTGLQEQFCLNVLPWYYDNNKTAVKGKQKTRDGDDIFMPALGYRVKIGATTVAYSGDTRYCDSLETGVRDADIAIIEATHAEMPTDEKRVHLCREEAEKAGKLAKAYLLIHGLSKYE